jgi:hypothetical protein
MDKKLKTTLILAGVAVAAYLIYRHMKNSQQSNTGTGQLGTNLNSVAPALIAGSSGPSSGLNYYAGSTTVYTAAPVSTATAPTATTSPTTPTTSTGSGRRWPVSNSATSSSGSSSGSTPIPVPFIGNSGTLVTTVSQFLANFRASGTNAGTLVPGGTGPPPGVKPVS